MANNIVKTPYEISVWEDKLYYQKITTWFEAAGSQQEGTQYYEATHAAAEYDPNARYYKLENGRYIYTVPPISTTTYVNYYLISPATSSTQQLLVLQHTEEEYDTDSAEPLNDNEQVISSFVEVPLAVIGSDTMDTPIRAHQPHLNCNINGTKTLTFLMYYRYYDYDVGDYVENPFIKLMVNERKIKLHYKNDWYDFIIKNIEESTDSTSITYVCQDQFITELGKTGFQLEFDTDLSNNTGTIEELGAAILDGTDWKLGDSDLLPQRTQEPLYVLSIASGTTLQCKYTRFENNEAVDYNATISGPTVIYAYYTPIIDQNPRVQFLYLPSGVEPKINDGILENSEQYYIDGVTYNASGIPNFAINTVLTPAEFQGKRLVRSYETLYDPKSQHTVSIYDNNWSGDPAVLYEYESYQYKAPVILENRLANTTLFENTSGWQSYGTNEMSIVSDPPVTETIDPNAKIYLSYTINDNDNTALRNDGLFAKPFTPGIVEGTTYVLRIKTPQRNTDLTARIVDYTDSQDSSTHLITPNFGTTTYLSFSSPPLRRHLGGDGRYYLVLENGNIYLPQDDEDDDAFYIATAANTLSYSEMRAKVAAFFLEGSVGNTYLIQGIELYEYLTEEVIDEHNRHYNTLMTPNTQNLKGKVTTIYNYYDPTVQPEIVSDPAEIKYYYSDITPLSGYTQRYRANYEKVRSITARESNRLNLIQSCCETFECWADFRIAHNESDGRLITELLPYIDVDGYVKYRVRADKTVTFKEFIGTDNYRGFRYGINLNSISRTIDSDAIVTKMIVSMNSNEHAENGFCTIARAPSNLTGEDFLISFDYYIHQGLLNSTQVYNDLYTKGPITMGYYSGLADINKSNKPLIEEQNDLVSRVIPRAQADLTMYTEARTAAANSKQEWVTLIEGKGCTREKYEAIIAIPPQSRTANQRQTVEWAKSYYIKIITFEQQVDYYNTLAEAAEARYNEYTARLDEIQDLLDKNVIRKQELNQDFYTKYSRFIQEGSWIDEDYVEDELYYLDALSVLTTSNQPEVNYNINVLELSELEGYENYTYKLGDKSYIEDTELFGYVTISGLRTPYQEEIIISETDDYFDEPENNTFKVQNYKTQFEDLFQRIAAETTNIQYASGSYNRAASVVNTDGTFNVAALQSTLNDSSLILSNLRDQSVVWDENGITITSDAYPLQIVRLVSRGIVLSNDGGQTWTVGISGSGINTAALSAGAIDTSLIVLRSGADPSFRWDSYGITAYDFSSVEETNTYDWSKFVRFDRFGLYGYDGHLRDTDFHPTSEADITGEEDVKFSLTWSGFRLRTNNGAVTITSDNDIQVFGPNDTGTGIIERIKIGELSDNVYGLRISDDSGAAVMETNSDGDLWLRKRLNISSSGNYNIGVGYLDGYKTVDQTQVHEVFNANNLFKVYEDGSMEATNGSFQGYINATGGQIGNLTINYNDEDHGTIADLVEGVQNFHIESVNGFIFTQQDGTISPTTLTLNAAGLSSADLAHTTWEVWNTATRINPENKVWEYNLNGSHEAASIVLSFSDLNIEHGFANNNILYLFATCGSKVARQSLNYITATAEVDQYQVVITSSQGSDISARDIQTALTAQVFLNGVECTADYDNFTYVWTRDSGTINEDTVYNYQLSGSSTRTLLTFNSVNAIYYCKVYLQDELLNIGEISLVSQANEDELYLSLSQDEVLIYYDENKQLTTSPNIITLVMQRYGDLTDNLTMASMQVLAAGQSIKRWINPKINVQYFVNNNPIKTYVDVYEYLHALGDIGGYTVTDEDLRGFAPGVTYYTYDYDDATGYGYTPVTSEYNAAQVYYTNQGDVEFLKWAIIDGDFTPTADQSPIPAKPYFTIEPDPIDFSGDPPIWETSRTITVGTQNVQLPIKYYRRYRLNGEDVYSRDITGSFYDVDSATTNFFIPDNGSLTLGETGGYLQVLSIVGNVTGSEYTTSTTPQPGVSFTIRNWTTQTQDTGVFVTYFDYDYYKDIEEQVQAEYPNYPNFPDGYYDIIFQAKSIDFFVKQLFEFMPNHIEEVYSNPNWAHTFDNLTSWSDIFKTFEQLKFHGIYVPADDSLNPAFTSGKTYYLAGRDGDFYTVTSVDGSNARPYTDKTYYIYSTTPTTDTYIGDGVTTTFNLYSRLADESSLTVAVNGTTISVNDFTINNNSVTLNDAPAVRDTINISYIYWTQDEVDWTDTNEYYYYNTRDKAFIKAGAKRVRTMQYYTFQPLSLESLTFLLELFNPEGDPYNVVNNNIQVAPKGTTVIPIRYGLNSDALEFQINAYNISAAIQNSKLLFDADGLHVYNGGFDIYNNAGDRVLYADTDGNLTLAGTIEATAGHIGGFTITDTTLTKDDLFVLDTNNLMLRLGRVGTGIIIDSNFDNDLYTSSLSIGQNLILTSKSSRTNSTIDTYPIFDFAPNGVSTLVLNSDGSVEGRNWGVNAEGHASFNDATVSGTVTGSNIVGSIIEGNNILGGVISGSEIDGGVINAGILNAVEINTATFNTKEVRSMGGTFIFRPTAKPIGYSVARPISYNTLTGPVISVNDDVGDLAITNLAADIESTQDLNGYDNPWPDGGGANLLDPSTLTSFGAGYGLTSSISGDVITLSGTYTGSNTSASFRTLVVPTHENWSFKAFEVTSTGTINNFRWASDSESNIVADLQNLTPNAQYSIQFKLVAYEAGTTAPASYVPYSNICPISGWTGVTVNRTGTNLVNQDVLLLGINWVKSPESLPTYKGAPVYSGTLANLCGSGKPLRTEIPVTFEYEENTRYRLRLWWKRGTPSTSNGIKIYARYTDGTTSSSTNQANNTEDFIRNGLLTSANKTVSKFYLSYSTSSSVYIAGFCIEKYDGTQVEGDTAVVGNELQTMPIDWTTEVGTVYGGTIDVATGVLTVTHASVILDGTNGGTYQYNGQSSTSTKGFVYVTDKANGTNNMISDMFSTTVGNVVGKMTGRVGSNGVEFNLPLTVTTSRDGIIAWFAENQPQLVYELATPQTYSLTPQQINTILGTNHIWTDIGNIEVNTNNSTQTITFDLPDDSFVDVSKEGEILRVNSYYGIIKQRTFAFTKTTDTVVDDEKTYYYFDSETKTYHEVEEPSGDPSQNDYYEATQPSISAAFKTTASLNLDSITSFLNLGVEQTTPIISISSEGYTPDGLLAGSGLSMTNVTLQDDIQQPQVVSHLFLGDFSTFKDWSIHQELPREGYGLVADNVFLRGSLTTQHTTQQGSSYSGINTISTIEFKHDEIPNQPANDYIIFWGGATDTTEDAIKDAPFQVSNHGNFYASSGLFQGSIISNATITGSTLEAAVIKGGDTAALRIYDTGVAGGIQFMKKVGSIDGSGVSEAPGNTDIITLGIDSTGLYTGEQASIEYFIKVDPTSHTAVYNGIFNSPNDINNHIQVNNTGVAYYIMNEGHPKLKTSLILAEKNIKLQGNSSQYIMVDSNSNILNNAVNQLNNEIIYQTVITSGNNDIFYRLNYKPNTNNSDNYGGYNLIVT